MSSLQSEDAKLSSLHWNIHLKNEGMEYNPYFIFVFVITNVSIPVILESI